MTHKIVKGSDVISEDPGAKLAINSCKKVNYKKFTPDACNRIFLRSNSPLKMAWNYRSLKNCQKARRCEKLFEGAHTPVRLDKKDFGYIPDVTVGLD